MTTVATTLTKKRPAEESPKGEPNGKKLKPDSTTKPIEKGKCVSCAVMSTLTDSICSQCDLKFCSDCDSQWRYACRACGKTICGGCAMRLLPWVMEEYVAEFGSDDIPDLSMDMDQNYLAKNLYCEECDDERSSEDDSSEEEPDEEDDE